MWVFYGECWGLMANNGGLWPVTMFKNIVVSCVSWCLLVKVGELPGPHYDTHSC